MISIGREHVSSIIPISASQLVTVHLVDVPDVSLVAVVAQLGVQVIELEVRTPCVRGVGRVWGRAAVVRGVAPT